MPNNIVLSRAKNTFEMHRSDAQKLADFLTKHNQKKFIIAADFGAYFSGVGVPVEGSDEKQNCVIYLPGIHHDNDEDWFDEKGRRLGYDDFGEFLDASLLTDFLTTDSQVFGIKLTKTKLSVYYR